MQWKTDISTGQVLCDICGKLHRFDNEVCNRCGSELHQKKPYSLAKTWAYLIAGIAFLIPANLLPMMIVTSLGHNDPGTIMSGVIYFFDTGAYGIGLVIFIASIAVPIFKLSVLLFLVIVAQFNMTHLAKISLKYYRIIEVIGKWSMLDIFVVALMVAMVQFKNIATIHAGPAALSFALSVVMTIVATQNFDPRLLWDSISSTKGKEQNV